MPFLSVLLLRMTLYGMDYPFGHFRLAILIVFPPYFLHTPNLHAGEKLEKEISLDTVQALLNSSQNTGVLSTPF